MCVCVCVHACACGSHVLTHVPVQQDLEVVDVQRVSLQTMRNRRHSMLQIRVVVVVIRMVSCRSSYTMSSMMDGDV